MSQQLYRLPAGGQIDRTRPLTFCFDGRRYQGYAGDTLASALLANGVRLVGRSFKYHRPRGIVGAGVEEPNAMVQLRAGAHTEPNCRATEVELFEGLIASSQNCWPSVKYDLGALNSLCARLLPAGFYYKTFMWPRTWWMKYERYIRAAAGMGKSAMEADPDRYDKHFLHCDVLVVGGGPAGLAAAHAASKAGARVVLVEERAHLGGSLNADRKVINDAPALYWVSQTVRELERLPRIVILNRATAFGYYDQNLIGVVERVSDHLPEAGPCLPRQRLWKIRARQVVLATGAIERPLVFTNNDRPGVMLASAVRRYVNQYAVQPGSRAVVFTNNDSAYATAEDLTASGVHVAAVVDVRTPDAAGVVPQRLRRVGTECRLGEAVVAVRGVKHVRAVDVTAVDPGVQTCVGPSRRIECDLLCVSGGWNPTVHLFSQSQGELKYEAALGAFLPGVARQAVQAVGAARGTFALSACLEEGFREGAAAAAAGGFKRQDMGSSLQVRETPPAAVKPVWQIPLPSGSRGKRFVDLQNDVTVGDVGLAAREGYHLVEHLKRYTTLGMGTDQGRTSNVNGLAILAELRGTDIPSVGTTTFRPPYTAVTLGTLAGRETGKHFAPVRRSAMHEWHVEAGAYFATAGLWLRPQYYPRTGEDLHTAVEREALAVRTSVGMVDISTLGKIEIQGPDAARYLERIYVNRWESLKVGRCRYGVMLREDGFVFDDGTTTRLGENHYYMTTTTAHAAQVLAHMEFYAQAVWPEMRVNLIAVSDQWAGMALAGPNSRSVLSPLLGGLDISNEAFPYLAFAEATLAGFPVRLLRITYSGELAYEIHTPADYGLDVWLAILEAGKAYGIVPYGTEAMNILRIEKGHVVVGSEIDGRTTPGDLGFGRMLKQDGDYVGRRSLDRPALVNDGRKQLVGLVAKDVEQRIPTGAQLADSPHGGVSAPTLGHVTSAASSPNLNKSIALGLMTNGRQRVGESIYALSPLTGQRASVTITEPVFFDPQGERARG